MILLGIASSHNSAAALMVDGQFVGLVQEERLTKRKNQTAFPKLAIKELLDTHLDGTMRRVDRVVFASRYAEPYDMAIDRSSDFSVQDHLRENHELWYPHFYEGSPLDGEYWRKKFIRGEQLNVMHNHDLNFLHDISDFREAVDYFTNVERAAALRRHFAYENEIDSIEHHECHAYYALYGSSLPADRRTEALVLTADAMGDCFEYERNWSASIVADNGSLERLDSGRDQGVARIYKFVTLILGMKPLEHEYKVMGLSPYSTSHSHIKAVEKIFFQALDFQDGRFVSENPLKDSYFDLKDRLEGHRFDNIAAGLQNWATEVTKQWVQHWLRKTGRRGLCFSGGLSMNVKSNGDLLQIPEVAWISVPPSGGDESLAPGACIAASIGQNESVSSLPHVYLGTSANAVSKEEIRRILQDNDVGPNTGKLIRGIGAEGVAKLLAADCIVARCIGPAEFGARALGNRSILANPSQLGNVKIINEAIKNRDFWMPFTPSIQAEFAEDYLLNTKGVESPFMTVAFSTHPEKRQNIVGALHPGDFTARPQFVSSATNREYWELIEAFRRLTGIPALLNTSLNLHGEPMNYTVADAVRTFALSGLEFLALPAGQLLYKKSAEAKLERVVGKIGADFKAE